MYLLVLCRWPRQQAGCILRTQPAQVWKMAWSGGGGVDGTVCDCRVASSRESERASEQASKQAAESGVGRAVKTE